MMKAQLVHESGVAIFDNALPDGFCDRAIALHSGSPHVIDSMSASGDKTHRSGQTLHLIQEEHGPFVNELFGLMRAAISSYGEMVPGFGSFSASFGAKNLLYFSAPRIEKINPGQGFNWHVDSDPFTMERCLAIVAYMNDVEEGGETEFKHIPVKAAPRKGRIVLFPPYWTHVHRGATPVSGAKYTIAAFLCQRRQDTVEKQMAMSPRPTVAAGPRKLDLGQIMKR